MAKTAQITISVNTKSAIKSIADLNNEIGESVVTVNDLRMTVDSLQQELESTEVGSERFKELKQALIETNTQLKNYELSIEALDSEQVASELKSVAGGFMDMAAGMVLIGASGQKMEELVQTFAQLEGATKIVTGGMEAFASFQKLQNNITTKAIALQESLAAATMKSGVSGKIASVGLGILNTVMNANPVFLLVTGLAALTAGLAYFFLSTNEAAEAQERFNQTMEEGNRLRETAQNIRQTNIKIQQNEISGAKEILNAEIKLLESKTKLNDAEKELLETKREALQELEAEELQIITDESVKQAKENARIINDQFHSIRLSIRATDEEDAGGDNIAAGYDSLLTKLQGVQTSFNNIERAFTTGQITAEEYKTGLDQIQTSATLLTNTLGRAMTELGADTDEGELFQGAIDGGDELVKVIRDASSNATDLVNTLQDTKTAQELAKIETETEKIARAEKEAKEREEARKKAMEKRKKLLEDINSIMNREKAALREIAKVRTQLIDDEFDKQTELANMTYGTERDKLIDGAIAREEAKLGEKFVKGLLSEKQYREAIAEVEENGADYLLDVEKQLLDEKKKLRDKEVQDIEDSRELERLSQLRLLQDVDVINQERLKRSLEMKKEEAIFVAEQTIKDEKELQERLLQINKQYQDREISLVRSMEKEKLDSRKAQYRQDIQNKELTDAEKLELEAQYNKDVVDITADAQSEVKAILEGTVEEVKDYTFQLTDGQQLIFDSVVAGIQQSMEIINQALQESADRATERREREYEREQEGLNALLANKTISQEAFDQKSAQLEQKKQQEETAAKRRQFRINKANDITNAVISTAQAVLQGLAAAPPPVGPILASINGALGAAQIGVISAQKFRAARGGVVPGSPSGVDSVDALLAPGEMVINSNSSSMFGSLLSEINQAGGGIPLAPQSQSVSPTFQSNDKQSVVRAYVVESEVTDVQKKVSRIERSSEF